MLCTCVTKAHLEHIGETCDCGGEDCACTQNLKNYNTENLFGGMLVHAYTGVTPEQVATAMEAIQTGYDTMTSGMKTNFVANIASIYVYGSGTAISVDSQKNLIMAYDSSTGDTMTYLLTNGYLTP